MTIIITLQYKCTVQVCVVNNLYNKYVWLKYEFAISIKIDVRHSFHVMAFKIFNTDEISSWHRGKN